jgi:hypothetical protein
MEKEFPQWYLHHVEGILFARWMACMLQWTQKLSAAASLLVGSLALDRFWAGCCSVWCNLILHTGVGELRILRLLARQVQHRQCRKRKDIVIDIKSAYNECQEKHKSWGTGVEEFRCEVDLSHRPVLRLRIRGAIPFLLRCVFIAWAELALPIFTKCDSI